MKKYKKIIILSIFSYFSLNIGLLANETIDFPFETYREVADLFEKLNYTPEKWQAGIRSVPRVFISHVPERWGATRSKEVSVADKKRVFFRILGPLVLRSNEMILADRGRLLKMSTTNNPAKKELDWLNELGVRYRVTDKSMKVGSPEFEELKRRVDIVPPSLALAQAAEESGWGTSRFADLGNAVFGQWTWGEKGITPKEQRSEKGDHKIASFDSPLSSVQSYMQNMNTHDAYKEFRAARASMRTRNEKISGWKLCETLTRYSERGGKYVESLRQLMRINRLEHTDDAFLAEGPTYILRPVGERSK